MATLWFNFPQNSDPAEGALPKQPDTDFLVPMTGRLTAVLYAKQIFNMLKTSRNEAQFVWEPLEDNRENDILERNPSAQGSDGKVYIRDYPLWRDLLPVADGNGFFLLARIRTNHFWLNICLADEYFTPFQKVQSFSEGKLIYSKIVRLPRDDAKQVFSCLANCTHDLSVFNLLIHVGLGVGEAEREEPYCFLYPSQTVEELDDELDAYMAQ